MHGSGMFEGKVVLITGAATGIGRATALAFARERASLVIGDLNEKEAAETVRLVRELGARAEFLRTDVSKESDVAALVKHAVDTFGTLDCAFNNAGIAATPVLLHETPEAVFDKEIAVDLKGVFLCLKHDGGQPAVLFVPRGRRPDGTSRITRGKSRGWSSSCAPTRRRMSPGRRLSSTGDRRCAGSFRSSRERRPEIVG